jgi:nucleotide-binding universal stress UspA family protein
MGAERIKEEGQMRGHIRTIGVGFDGSPESEAALVAAVEACRRLGANLRVIRAFDPDSVTPAFMDGPGYISARESLERMAREGLDAAVAGLPADVAAEGLMRAGSPADVLAAESADLDLLMLGSRGYGPLRAVLLRGVSAAVVRKAHCPVVVLPHGEHSGLDALFAPAEAVSPAG